MIIQILEKPTELLVVACKFPIVRQFLCANIAILKLPRRSLQEPLLPAAEYRELGPILAASLQWTLISGDQLQESLFPKFKAESWPFVIANLLPGSYPILMGFVRFIGSLECNKVALLSL